MDPSALKIDASTIRRFADQPGVAGTGIASGQPDSPPETIHF